MESLVENIETWSLNKFDTKLFENVKKQLKDKKTNINKLSKNLKGDAEIAPLHAAVASNSPELFNLVLETEGVNPDPEYYQKGEPVGGILDFAVLCLNIDMVQLVLEKIKYSDLQMGDYGGEAIATCLVAAIESDRLDLVELLLGHEEKYPKLNPFHCLVLALRDNRGKIFTKVLPKLLSKINQNQRFGDSSDTLLHKAAKNRRVRMLRQLVEAGCDVNAKDAYGVTPLSGIVIVASTGICGDGCCAQIVSELLGSKSIDLDIAVEGIEDGKAIDFLDAKTCPHVRKLVEQAYSRDTLRKKLEKRKEQKASEVQSKKESFCESKSDQTEYSRRDENKICWSCSADPENVTLFRCRGCKAAWYCGDKCQEMDWPVHGPWCDRKRKKRKEKHEAKADEVLAPRTRMPEVFYDLD